MHGQCVIAAIDRPNAFSIAAVFILRDNMFIALSGATYRRDGRGRSPVDSPFLESRTSASISHIDPPAVGAGLHDAGIGR